MTQKYSFFDAVEGLPKYTAQDVADRTAALAGKQNGYLVGNQEGLTVAVAGTNVTLQTGAALIQGRLYVNDEDIAFSVPLCSTGKTRQDRVVIKLDTAVESRNITAYIKQGVEGVSGISPPSLTQAGTIYELSVARLEITDTAIIVVDERDTDTCPELYTGEAAAQVSLGHSARTNNPHGVTKAQVGLGNADNTADADKPLSTAALAEFSNYLAKTSIVDDLVTGGSGKVLSAEQGKILAQNDLNMLFLAKMKSAIVIENGDFSEEIFNYSWNNTHHYQYTELGGQYIGFRAVHQDNGTWQYLTNSDSNNGHKIYFSVDIKPASSTTVVRLGQDGGLGATVISPTFIGQWQRVSGIYTVSTSPGPRPYFSFGDTASSGWQEHFIRRVVVLDLTMLYGRGLEPATTTEVDIYVNLYLNHLNKPIGIRHGANANGTYIKFPDGTMECYGTKLIPSVSFSSANAVYYALLPTIAFAATFYNVPIVVSSVEMGNVGATQVSGISTTGFTGAIISASSATFDVTIRFIAKGRWKA